MAGAPLRWCGVSPLENYYDVLGAYLGYSQEQIKRCFRQRAKELHPDLTVLAGDQAEPRMRRLLEAYSVLGDLNRRRDYDFVHRVSLRRRGRFDYRSFLRSQRDPASLAKLVLYDLMRSRDREALSTYSELEGNIGTDLFSLLGYDDFMDCCFLLAEAFERDGEYDKACGLYLRIYRAETARPYFRHFIAEVVERMRVVACFKMDSRATPLDSIRRIEELIELKLSDRESAFFCKRIAEIYSDVGALEEARRYLERALRFNDRIVGVKRLKERVGLLETVIPA